MGLYLLFSNTTRLYLNTVSSCLGQYPGFLVTKDADPQHNYSV